MPKIKKILGIKFKYYTKVEKTLYKYLKIFKKEQVNYKKDSYLLFDHLCDKTAECIDAYSLFEYFYSINKKVYYVCLKDSKIYKDLEKRNRLNNVIGLDFSSNERPDLFFNKIFNILLRTKIVITSFDIYSAEINNFFVNADWLEYIYIKHGITFFKTTNLDIKSINPQKYNKILVSCDYEKDIFTKYGFTENQFIKGGLPRWDLIKKGDLCNEKSILFMFTWRRLNISNFDDSFYKKNILSLLNNNELSNYLKDNKIKLYFAPHHVFTHFSGIDFKPSNSNCKVISTQKISDYVQKCNILITDYSSIAFDFMFQNKPVIHYIPDKKCPQLDDIAKEEINNLDSKKDIMPNMFFDEQNVVEKIKYYIENNFQLEQNTKDIYNKFFPIKTNIRAQLIDEIAKIAI